ncbi:MAG: DNA-binding protein [Gammaproteobacteria bacterium]|jgi:hypothetical protein|nr:DNA-binding protein [Gammaproteobacteria bacterium]MBT3488927.1 DNA-binding protein [Gammaproteobacteria bacterium]MBT3719161.1 DNA-binding protein [Gammaproteobacteria bacterium]MBT3846148.1 DNA-binding protein [Gammaproteobacteria bacterium]MBT3894211.1 DNA-binding protein [Gammaproteobacteria bacterium]
MSLKRSLAFAILFTLPLTSPLTWAVNQTGTVMETMVSGGYTYAKVLQNEKEFWIAGPTANVDTGDIISFDEQMSMPNFTSKSLNRTFDSLMFVGRITEGYREALNAQSAFSHPKVQEPKTMAPAAKISKAENGYTVAELFSRKDELNNRAVTVRGQVVKVSKRIMKKDWVHIQDGTGTAGTNNIIFTAGDSNIKVGDIVLASGNLVTNRDFGFGYKYEVIIEDASFEDSK